MKKLMIALILVLASSSGFSNIFKKDSSYVRPRLLLKTSSRSLFNWRSSIAYVDLGAEVKLFGPITLDADIGSFYRPLWMEGQEYTNGYFADAGLRFYPSKVLEDYYFGFHCRYQKKKAVSLADFTEAGMPYSKYINIDRNSNFVYVLVGMSRNLLSDRFYFDYNLGLGIEHRVGVLNGLTDFEQEAIETGLVDGTKFDDEKGRLLPAVYIELKLGFVLVK